MATVEPDFDLYSCAQEGKTTDDYYKIFTSIVDTINANGGNAGLHASVFKKHFQPMIDKRVKDLGKELSTLSTDELKEIDEAAILDAKEAAQNEYLACLFLLLAEDERYGPLKTQLDNNFLMEEQEYPSDVLAAKRLMTDFVPATGAVKQTIQESGPSHVAFVETGDREYPTCYACGRKHRG